MAQESKLDGARETSVVSINILSKDFTGNSIEAQSTNTTNFRPNLNLFSFRMIRRLFSSGHVGFLIGLS